MDMEGEPAKEIHRRPDYIAHDEYYRVWQVVKSGGLEDLEGWDRVTGDLMLQHPEYQDFWDVPHAFAMDNVREAFEQRRANPDLHLWLETLIIAQIEESPEVAEALDAILRIGKDEHEARHIIGRVFTKTLWEGAQSAKKAQQPDDELCLRGIRRLIEHPEDVIEEHKKEDSNMELPSDEELESAILESERQFSEALAMPNRTISEALVQGAELVNAIAAKVFLLMAGLTEPRRGVVYEDELEARAAIATFREACNDVLNKLDEVLRLFDERGQ